MLRVIALLRETLDLVIVFLTLIVIVLPLCAFFHLISDAERFFVAVAFLGVALVLFLMPAFENRIHLLSQTAQSSGYLSKDAAKKRLDTRPLIDGAGAAGSSLVTIDIALLPKPESRSWSFITSAAVNLTILSLSIYLGMTARRVIQQHRSEQTELIFPTTPPPPPLKMKMPSPPKVETPKLPELKLDAPRIKMPQVEAQPDLKPVQMEARTALPAVKEAKPCIVLAPQPKAALTAAAPAGVAQARPSTAPVHLGETFGVTPVPNATRPATVAAIGNPYGGMQGPAMTPRGIVGSAGIGNGTKAGSNAGTMGKVAAAGIPGGTGPAATHIGGKVAAAGIPAMQAAVAPAPAVAAAPKSTNLEVISKPLVQYTSEARALRIQGDVVLRVTFTAAGQVQVQGVVQSLGHGLDEEARRVTRQIRFRPATRNGQAVDLTTNITITFQLA